MNPRPLIGDSDDAVRKGNGKRGVKEKNGDSVRNLSVETRKSDQMVEQRIGNLEDWMARDEE